MESNETYGIEENMHKNQIPFFIFLPVDIVIIWLSPEIERCMGGYTEIRK